MSENVEYGTTGKPHPYHILKPSPWPLIGALAGGIFAVGCVMYMHEVKIGDFEVGISGVILGLLAILGTMFGWWRDVIHEGVTEKAHSDQTMIGFRWGMGLFIASEVMFFFAFFWAYFDASLFAGQEIMFQRVEHTGGTWPPQGVEVFDPLDLPFLMTMILLLSGCTVTWAHHAIMEGHNEDFVMGLALSVALGVIFLGFQVYEYTHAAFGFTEGIYPSTFYMATGFHGFHVLVGTIFLFVCWRQAKLKHFTKEKHFGFEAAAWYWHFVDVVWLFLFISIYFWGSIGAEIH